ncbi:hypothetical protein DXE05_16240 [Vibrio parahaemolyticus]|nr:hypothetical protein DXE05_16240 [Vibrio parahaemolyticus]
MRWYQCLKPNTDTLHHRCSNISLYLIAPNQCVIGSLNRTYTELSRLCCLIQRKGIPAHNASFLNNILSFRHT